MENMQNKHRIQHSLNNDAGKSAHSLAIYKRFGIIAITMFGVVYFIMYAMIDKLVKLIPNINNLYMTLLMTSAMFPQMEARNETMPTKGEIVSPDEVCMVNDPYIGKKQLEVKFNDKTYYGWCEMCKEPIPKDASVRFATDPFSQKQVDKSTAMFAVTGDNGEVSYFENKANYNSYLKVS